MSNIFISYNRDNELIAKVLDNDIQALGHSVWFDQELSGGQAWWDQILASIRDCDVFVFVLSQKSLNSTACNREYGYASDLGKPVLPVMVSKGVSTNLLPPALSKIQFVDYQEQGRDAAFRLARALASVSTSESLPDPLPAPPGVPLSYLGSLTEQIGAAATLNYEEQSVLTVDLRKSLRDPETMVDARALLKKFRRRRDLLATIADEIDELLASSHKTPPASTHMIEPDQPPLESPSKSTNSESYHSSLSVDALQKHRRRWGLSIVICLLSVVTGWGVAIGIGTSYRSPGNLPGFGPIAAFALIVLAGFVVAGKIWRGKSKQD